MFFIGLKISTLKKKTTNKPEIKNNYQELIQFYKEFAYGYLHWSPLEFKSATILDMDYAYIGWQKANGLYKQKPEPPTKQELMKWKRKYPDDNN